MRNFLFNVFIILTLFSCSSYKDSFISVQKTQESFTPAFLTEKNLEQIFKISIEVYGHDFGGVLAIKKLESKHYRIALITEIGAKLLDFELINGEMKLNYGIEQLNRKIILNILKQDFLILLNENAAIQSQYSFEGNTVYQTQLSGKDLYYFLDSGSLQLQKSVWASRKKEKTVFTYQYSGKGFPDIEIDHKSIKLKIQLRLLENEL